MPNNIPLSADINNDPTELHELLKQRTFHVNFFLLCMLTCMSLEATGLQTQPPAPPWVAAI